MSSTSSSVRQLGSFPSAVILPLSRVLESPSARMSLPILMKSAASVRWTLTFTPELPARNYFAKHFEYFLVPFRMVCLSRQRTPGRDSSPIRALDRSTKFLAVA